MPDNQAQDPPEAPQEVKETAQQDPIEKHLSAQVDNAHASGLGAMGRNDEKLPTGADEEAEHEDPMY